jgi:predicted methyltransferase
MQTPLFDQAEYDYYKVMIPNLLTLELNKWWNIKPDRQDKELFISAIKNRIDYYQDFEFNADYTKFKRIASPKEQKKEYSGQITYTIEWKEQSQVEIDYSHLPEPKYTEKKKIVKRRAV